MFFARKSNDQSSRFVAWIALFLSVVLAGCSGESSQQTHRTMPAPQVGVVTLKSQPLPVSTALPGRTSAYQVSEVRPQVGGILLKRLFKEGADVKAGEVLYQIDPASYQAAYDSAKASLAQAEATVSSARPKAERYHRLMKADAISKQDADDAVATLKAAEASVAAAKAAVETARINLDYTKIRAPISGQIGTSSVTPGALLTADQATALTTINQLNPIYVDVSESSTDLLKLRKALKAGKLKAVDGKPLVSIVLEDGSTYSHTGKLEVIGSSVDTSTGTVALRARVPNPDHLLLPGMYVTARLSMAVNEKAVLVPQQAVSHNSKGEATALVVDHQGKVEQRIVQTGATVGHNWVVNGGLKAGEKVIVEGTMKVRPGEKVRTVEVQLGQESVNRTVAASASASNNSSRTE